MNTSLYQEVIPPYTRRFYLRIPGGNTSLYIPGGNLQLEILSLRTREVIRFGLAWRLGRNAPKSILKTNEANSTGKKQAISKLNQAIYMVRYRIRLLLLRAKLTLGLDAFDCLTCLTFLKLRA